MANDVLISYALAVLGAAIIGVSIARVIQQRLNHKLANTQLLKLLKGRNPDRLAKLCAAAPNTYFDAVGASLQACKAAHASRPPPDGAALLEIAHDAFDLVASKLARRWQQQAERALYGGLLIGGGVGLMATVGSLPPFIASVGGLAVLALIWLFAQRRGLAVTIASTREEVLPAMVHAVLGTESAPAPAPDRAPAHEPDRTPAPGPDRTPTPDRAAEAAPDRASPPPAPGSATDDAAPSLAAGACPLCQHTTITRVDDPADPRFHRLVCRGCGYAQAFADLDQLDA